MRLPNSHSHEFERCGMTEVATSPCDRGDLCPMAPRGLTSSRQGARRSGLASFGGVLRRYYLRSRSQLVTCYTLGFPPSVAEPLGVTPRSRASCAPAAAPRAPAPTRPPPLPPPS